MKQFFTDEKGEVNIVAIVVLIGIAVLLAVVFKGKIQNSVVPGIRTTLYH
jgi:flagellin-like protein